MLAQDPVTGQLYEVPDNQPYGIGYAEAPMVYDGLGNPVGFLPFLAPLAAKVAAKALPRVAKYVAPLAQRFLPKVLPAITRAAGGIAPQIAQQAAQARLSVTRAFTPPVPYVSPVPYMPAPMPSSPMPPSAEEEEYGQYGQYAPPGPMYMPPPAPMALPGQPMPGQFPLPVRPRPYCRAPQPVGWITPALPFTGMRPRRLYLRCSVWPGPKGLVPAIATQPGAPGAVPGMAPGTAPGTVQVPPRRRRRRGRR
jgi:hypothetical protein